ncbi:MAG: cyclic nucleotide-binding domain-containing protein [Candidatus Latescibacteria bacterium]|nr:cyclic nucleotide-binding domain-containing protein [Candidatus Latescibacterota bacterium]
MLTTVEKVMLLREVDIFSQVSTEQLAYLAAILEEQHCPAGEVVYQQQDPADAMYLVASGQVRVHREQLEITVAGPGEAFGTWALFDEEPRLSAATAVEDALLLRLDKEDFIDLLADNVEITQGVLKALVKRVRGLIGQVA